MTRHRYSTGIAVALLFALLGALPAAAQSDDEATAESTPVDVRGGEYAYVGLPTSLPAGSSLGFTNDGAEVHELALARIGDDVTESLEELLAMEDPVGAGLVEIIGDTPLFAAPGAVAEGTLSLEREGRYVAICFIPQGLTDMAVMEQAMTAESMDELPEDVQAILSGAPHFTLGMLQEFTVTAAGTEPGPLPEPADEDMADEETADEAPAAEESADPAS